MAANPFVVDVTTADFATTVLERSKTVPVVVDFWAAWCGPCRMLGPVLERLAGEGGGAWILAKVDTDANQDLARRFGIQGIPAVKAFRDGKVVAEFVGVKPEMQIRTWLGTLAPSKAEIAVRDALAAVERGDPDGARARFDAVLAEDPRQPDALLFRARDALARGDRPAAQAALATIREEDRPSRAHELGRLAFAVEAPPLGEAEAAHAAAPDDPGAIYAHANALAAAERWEEALDLFLLLVRKHRPWGDDAGRKAMLRVFDVVGIRAPLADTWRRRLSMELYK